MKRAETTAARRYARALLEVAFTSAQADPASLRRELEETAARLESRRDLSDALTSPALPQATKREVVNAVWRDASPLLRRLLGMLVERGRTGLVAAIAATYAELWNAARGVVPAEAISAVPLEPDQLSAVERALGRAARRDVELRASVDPQVMGGLMVRIGGLVYDGTVRGRLRALRERLAQAD